MVTGTKGIFPPLGVNVGDPHAGSTEAPPLLVELAALEPLPADPLDPELLAAPELPSAPEPPLLPDPLEPEGLPPELLVDPRVPELLPPLGPESSLPPELLAPDPPSASEPETPEVLLDPSMPPPATDIARPPHAGTPPMMIARRVEQQSQMVIDFAAGIRHPDLSLP